MKFKIFSSESISQKVIWGHWFLFFNILFVILIASRYAFLIDWADTFLARMYFIIYLIGHFGVLAFICYLLIIFPLSFIIKNNSTFVNLSCLVFTCFLSMILFDTEIYKQFKLHINQLIWDLLIDPRTGAVFSIWQQLFIPIPLILLLEIILGQMLWFKIRFFAHQKWLKYFGGFIFLLFICSHLIYTISDAVMYRPITQQVSYLPFSHPMHARQFLNENGFINLDEYKNNINNVGSLDSAKMNYPRSDIIYQAENINKYNILFINIDGLTSQYLKSEYMPNLTRIANESINFNNNYAGSTSSMGAAVNLFYGIDANYLNNILRMKQQPLLFSALEHNNYKIDMFSSHRLKAPIFNRLILKNQNYIYKSNLDLLYLDWKNNLQTRIEQQQLWFNYINYTIANNDYLNQLNLIDNSINKVITYLKEKEILTNTVIIITGNNEIPNMLEAKINEFKVPLIVLWPDKKAQIYNKLTSNNDIIATILPKILGVSNIKFDYTHGYDLFDETHNWIMINNRVWNVVVNNNQSIYYLSRDGDYYQSSITNKKDIDNETSLGILLQALKQNRLFTAGN